MSGLIQADARHLPLRDECIDCVVTSPPYFGLRDYGSRTQIGLELTLSGYIESIRSVFQEIRRVLKPTGTAWLNLGDSYANDGKWGGEIGGKQSYLQDNDRKSNHELWTTHPRHPRPCVDERRGLLQRLLEIRLAEVCEVAGVVAAERSPVRAR